MKKKITLLVLCILSSFTVSSQSFNLINSGYGDSEDIFFVNNDTGFVIAEGGHILKTENRGKSWKIDFIDGSFNSLFSLDNSIFYAVGSQGKVIKCVLNDTAWYDLNTNISTTLEDVYFINKDTGFVIGMGGFIYNTKNGGVTWNLLNSNTTENLFSINFPSPDTGYIAGWDSTILRSVNGGETWTHLSVGFSGDFLSIDFINNSTGYVCGSDGIILKTLNSGLTWSVLNSGISTYLYSVKFIDSSNGFASGSSGVLLKTIDGGTNWEISTIESKNGTKPNIKGICYNSNNMFLCGDYGLFSTSFDGGTNWSHKFYSTFTSIYIDDELNYYFSSGNSDVFKTQNPEILLTNVSNPFNVSVEDVWFINQDIGFAVGQLGRIKKTIDGGDSWQSVVVSGIGSEILNEIYFINQDTGFIVGASGMLLKTVNQGSNWSKITAPTSEGLLNIFFYDNNNGFVVGANGTILKTSDNGESWEQNSIGGTRHIRSVFFIDLLKGFVVCDDGYFYKTIDGGLNWNIDELQNIYYQKYGMLFQKYDVNLITIDFFNDSIGVIVSAKDILKTTDGGNTWDLYKDIPYVLLQPNYHIIDAGFENMNKGYLVGTDNIIISFDCAAPSDPISIIGSTSVCQGQNDVLYTVPPIVNASNYLWSLPNDFFGESDSNSILININSLAISGLVSLRGQNSCGLGPETTVNVTVNPLPSNAGTISGSINVCKEDNLVYSVSPISNTTSYNWTLPSGVNGTSISESIIVDFSLSSLSGNISVKGENACGFGQEALVSITVNDKPNKPFILLNNNIIESNYISGNQWYFNNTIMLGDNNQILEPSLDGEYYTIVTLSGCASEKSNSLSFTPPNSIFYLYNDRFVKFYPNPTNSIITFNLNNFSQKITKLNIFDINGRLLKQVEIIDNETITVDLSNYKTGVYMYQLQLDDNIYSGKIIKK